jgi:glycerol-3-phosphate acyltransferase PlsY
MEFVALSLLAYLIGSIPFGYIIAKYNQVDIQKVGSGNIGATNVTRTLGAKWGALTLILDIAKGFVAISLVNIFFDQPLVGYYILAGSSAILGHFKSIWLKLKGGKVVATSLGVLLGLTPAWFIFIILSVFVLTIFLAKKFGSQKIATQNVALGSMLAAITAVIVKIFFGGGFNAQNYGVTIFIIGIMIIILIAHKDNIKKII